MASRNVVTNIDLVQNNDASVPDGGFTRIKAKVDGDVVVILPSGVEKSIVNEAPVTVTQLNINGGASNTVFSDYLIRLDFGANGSTINPSGTP